MTSPGWTDLQLDGPDLPETQLESDSMQRQATYRDVKADALDAMSCISSGEAVLDDGLDLPEPEPQPEMDSMQRQATYLDVKADALDAMSCISPGEQVPDDCHDLPELQPEVNSMQPQTSYLDAFVAQSPPTEDRSESKGKTEGFANAFQMIIQEFREAEAAQTPPRTKRDAAKDGPHFLDIGNISNLKLFYANSLKCHIFMDVRFLCGHVYDFEAGCDFAR